MCGANLSSMDYKFWLAKELTITSPPWRPGLEENTFLMRLSATLLMAFELVELNPVRKLLKGAVEPYTVPDDKKARLHLPCF